MKQIVAMFIKEHKLIKNLGVNLGSEYKYYFKFDEEKNELNVIREINHAYVNVFKHTNFINVSGIVGDAGAGKSSLIDSFHVGEETELIYIFNDNSIHSTLKNVRIKADFYYEVYETFDTIILNYNEISSQKKKFISWFKENKTDNYFFNEMETIINKQYHSTFETHLINLFAYIKFVCADGDILTIDNSIAINPSYSVKYLKLINNLIKHLGFKIQLILVINDGMIANELPHFNLIKMKNSDNKISIEELHTRTLGNNLFTTLDEVFDTKQFIPLMTADYINKIIDVSFNNIHCSIHFDSNAEVIKATDLIGEEIIRFQIERKRKF